MGTDICIYFEFCRIPNEQSARCWYPVTIGKGGNEYDVSILFSKEEFMELAIRCNEDYSLWKGEGLEHDTNRSYSLFGLLAGIRDLSVTPLAEPRGFPEDSAYYRNVVIRAELEHCHTFTYFSLTELIYADTKHNRLYCEYERMAKITQPLIMFARENNMSTDDFRAIICFN